ncbi:hypothetical protein ACIBEA_44520 [Streptomyces sp. NPDC051555]|uniref:hypothetical protein n=1 Tax=Streptomyces sp. NPDC051555 TaxID=3365657 RepID=UPI00378B88B3
MSTVHSTGEYERYRLVATGSQHRVTLERAAIIKEIKGVWMGINSSLQLEGVPWAQAWSTADTSGRQTMPFTRAAIQAARQKLANEDMTGRIVPCPPGEQRALAMLLNKMVLDCTSAKSHCQSIPKLEALTSLAQGQKLTETGLPENSDLLVKLGGFNNYPGDVEGLCFHSVMSHNRAPDDVKFYAFGWAVKAIGPDCEWYREYDMNSLCGSEYGHRAGIIGVWHMFRCVLGICKCSEHYDETYSGDSTLDTIMAACLWTQATRVAILDIDLTVEQEVMYNVYVTYGNAMYSALRDLMHETQHSMLWLMQGETWQERLLTLIEDVISLTALVCDLNKISISAGSTSMGCFAAGMLMRRYAMLEATSKAFRVHSGCTGLCRQVTASTVANIALELAQSSTRTPPSVPTGECACDLLIDTAVSTLGQLAEECPVPEAAHAIKAMHDLAKGVTNDAAHAYGEINRMFVFMMSAAARSTCVLYAHGAAFLAMITAYVNIMRHAMAETQVPVSD